MRIVVGGFGGCFSSQFGAGGFSNSCAKSRRPFSTRKRAIESRSSVECKHSTRGTVSNPLHGVHEYGTVLLLLLSQLSTQHYTCKIIQAPDDKGFIHHGAR